MKKLSFHHGFSLVELAVGMTIIILAISSGLVIVRSMTSGFVSMTLSRKAVLKTEAMKDEIRKLAVGDGFDAMGTGGEWECDRSDRILGGQDKSIRVCAKIEDIDRDSRTRLVTLVTSYMVNGTLRTSTKTFTVANVRGEASGARVHVKVVDQNRNPISGVKITLPSMGGVNIDATTPGSGTLLFENVKLSQSGVDVVVDGYAVRSYFYHSTPPHTFRETFRTGATKVSSDEKTFLMSPIEMRRPGVLTGIVSETNTAGTPAPDVRVQIFRKSVDIDAPPLNPEDTYRKTDASGQYRFEGLIPGQYFIYVHGSPGKYAAIARPNDKWMSLTSTAGYTVNPNTDWVTITENTTINKDFKVVKRGTLKGQIYKVTYNGSSFSASVYPNKVKLRIFRYIRNTFVEPTGQSADFSNSQATIFLNDSAVTLPSEKPAFETRLGIDPNGNYSFDSVGPWIVTPDDISGTPDSNFLFQYSTGVLLSPFHYSAAGAFGYKDVDPASAVVPILVSCPGGFGPGCTKENVKMIALGSEANLTDVDLARSFQLRGGAVISDLYPRIYAGSDSNYDIYLLSKDVMGTITGNVHIHAPAAPAPAPDCATIFSRGSFQFDPDPALPQHTYVLFDNGVLSRSFASFYITGLYESGPHGGFTTARNGCDMTYTMTNLIPPTLGQLFELTFVSQTNVFKPVDNPLTVEAWGKRFVPGTPPTFQQYQLTDAQLDGKTFQIEIQDVGTFLRFGTVDANHVFIKNAPIGIQGSDVMDSNSGQISLDPGQMKDGVANPSTYPEVNITLNPTGVVTYPSFYLYPKWAWRDLVPYTPTPTKTRFDYVGGNFVQIGAGRTFKVLCMGRLPTLVGTVKKYDSTGALVPVENAEVRVSTANGSRTDPHSPPLRTLTVADMDGQGHQFVFNNVKYYPEMNRANLMVSVKLDGYQTSETPIEVGDGFNLPVNIILTKIVSPQSGN